MDLISQHVSETYIRIVEVLNSVWPHQRNIDHSSKGETYPHQLL